ncbi:hypothetical protein ALT_0743 [Aspergillus lentulus]|uniref:Peptidase S8/S53 domain-containing protein n=1 Tax=Aspergillus lentulus TaxID=293939 RepID=A0AAN4T753_ASPLE|nr:hypothetical protein ALT_0743 [Aspergillus lentulus]
MATEVEFSVMGGEVLAPGTEIDIHAPRPVNPQGARSAVIVTQDGRNVFVPVTVDQGGTTIRICTEHLGQGSFYLQVDELLDNNGKELLHYQKIPVSFHPLVRNVPRSLRVVQASYIAVSEEAIQKLLPGKSAPPGFQYVGFILAFDEKNGDPVSFAFNEKGEQIDGKAILDKFHQTQLAKLGRLHETLLHKLETVNASQPLSIAVWPEIKLDLTGYDKPNEGEIEKPPEAARALVADAVKVRGAIVKIMKDLGATVEETPPEQLAIYATLEVSQVPTLAQTPDVGQVFLDDRTGLNDLVNSEAIGRAAPAQALGYTGQGVRVAVFEAGPSDLTYLAFDGRYTESPEGNDHARLTSAIIKNVEPGKPHGYAPYCSLYSANSYDNAALRWAVGSPQNCTVVSQSFHRPDEQHSASLSVDDILKDHLATQWPFPTIVQSAGNVSQASQYLSVQKPSLARPGRELPELAANGTGVTAVGLTMSGTSFSASAVAGTAALLQGVNSTLKSWPEGCKAILLASAGPTVSGDTWAEDNLWGIDQSDGSGALNAEIGVLIAQNRQWRDLPPAPRGWDVGSLKDIDFASQSMSKFFYKVAVPDPDPATPRNVYTVKVALAWDAKFPSNVTRVQSPTVAFLLAIYKSNGGRPVRYSGSFDNNYEIVEFIAMPGEEYHIHIARASGSGTVWYGLAWNVSSSADICPVNVPAME